MPKKNTQIIGDFNKKPAWQFVKCKPLYNYLLKDAIGYHFSGVSEGLAFCKTFCDLQDRFNGRA